MLLLAADTITLFAAGAADTHGWAQPGTTAAWTGQGSLQAGPGRTDPLAADAGGHGPFAPQHGLLAVLYLPPDAPVTEGMVAEVGGQHYHLSQARLVKDPLGSGGLDCWVAVATGTDDWPPDG